MTRSINAEYSPADAEAVGQGLARLLGADDALAPKIGHVFALEQLAWQSDGKGITEARLVTALNRELNLQSGPSYFMLDKPDLRRARVFMWTRVPRLNGGVAPRGMAKGHFVVNATMSPFEALAAGGLLLYQKAFNDDFVLTPAERLRSHGKAAIAARQQSRTPGFHGRAANDRLLAFRGHLAEQIGRKWNSVDATVGAMAQMLKELRHE